MNLLTQPYYTFLSRAVENAAKTIVSKPPGTGAGHEDNLTTCVILMSTNTPQQKEHFPYIAY